LCQSFASQKSAWHCPALPAWLDDLVSAIRNRSQATEAIVQALRELRIPSIAAFSENTEAGVLIATASAM
jgi:hypothetical protein